MTLTTSPNLFATQLDELCAQLELSQPLQRAALIEELAQQHPPHAAALHDFFALLTETELDNALLFANAQPATVSAMANGAATATVTASSRSLLALLGEHAKLKATQIAAQLDVPYLLLMQLQRHALSVPQRVRIELAERAARVFQFDYATALQALSQPYSEAMAASRDTAYQHEEVSFQEMLKRAGLSKKEQQYWLGLADE